MRLESWRGGNYWWDGQFIASLLLEMGYREKVYYDLNHNFIMLDSFKFECGTKM